MLKRISNSERGFKIYDFADNYNNEEIEKPYTIRKCSHATSECFWMDIGDETIHISNEDMAHIVDIFTPFLDK